MSPTGHQPGCRPSRRWSSVTAGWSNCTPTAGWSNCTPAARQAELAEQVAASASDYPRLIELGQQLRAVESEKAELEDRWLAVAENISAP
jgi:hypothetical protein